MRVGLLWVGKGAKALVGVEPGGIGRYRVECGVRWVSGTPRGVRPPNFGAKGPLVGPGDLQ